MGQRAAMAIYSLVSSFNPAGIITNIAIQAAVSAALMGQSS